MKRKELRQAALDVIRSVQAMEREGHAGYYGPWEDDWTIIERNARGEAEYSVSWPNLQITIAKLAEALLPEAERTARRAEAADREYREHASPEAKAAWERARLLASAPSLMHEMFPDPEEESREEEETAHV